MATAEQSITVRVTPEIEAWVQRTRGEGESRASRYRRILGERMKADRQAASQGGLNALG